MSDHCHATQCDLDSSMPFANALIGPYDWRTLHITCDSRILFDCHYQALTGIFWESIILFREEMVGARYEVEKDSIVKTNHDATVEADLSALSHY